MGEYTKVNLRDVEDQGPKFGFAPNLEARFAGGPLGLEQSGLSYQRFAPSFRAPFGHSQKQQEELYVVVGGSARVKLDDEVVELEQWDALRVPAAVTRCFEAGPEGAEVLAFGAPKTGDSPAEDVEMTPNWWTDEGRATPQPTASRRAATPWGRSVRQAGCRNPDEISRRWYTRPR